MKRRIKQQIILNQLIYLFILNMFNLMSSSILFINLFGNNRVIIIITLRGFQVKYIDVRFSF